MDELKDVIRKMAAEIAELDEGELTDARKFTELGLDSLQALELLVAIERRYECQIPQEELKHFTDLGSVVRAVAPIVLGQVVCVGEQA
jgi:acyl carrier protein